MKKFLVFLILFGCSMQAGQSAYYVTFDPNTEPDMSHYNLYVWVGADTLQCPFFEGMPILPNDPLLEQTILYTVVENRSAPFWVESNGRNYVTALLQAVDVDGNLSPGARSDHHLTIDATAPGTPRNINIEREQ